MNCGKVKDPKIQWFGQVKINVTNSENDISRDKKRHAKTGELKESNSAFNGTLNALQILQIGGQKSPQSWRWIFTEIDNDMSLKWPFWAHDRAVNDQPTRWDVKGNSLQWFEMESLDNSWGKIQPTRWVEILIPQDSTVTTAENGTERIFSNWNPNLWTER